MEQRERRRPYINRSKVVKIIFTETVMDTVGRRFRAADNGLERVIEVEERSRSPIRRALLEKSPKKRDRAEADMFNSVNDTEEFPSVINDTDLFEELKAEQMEAIEGSFGGFPNPGKPRLCSRSLQQRKRY